MVDQGRSGEFPNRLSYELKIETVVCPTCKAPRGLPCITMAGKAPGKPMKGFHKSRETAAMGAAPPTPASMLNQFGQRPGKANRWSFKRKKG